jgi:hypothetical protein
MIEQRVTFYQSALPSSTSCYSQQDIRGARTQAAVVDFGRVYQTEEIVAVKARSNLKVPELNMM